VGVGAADWAPGEGDGETIASSMECIMGYMRIEDGMVGGSSQARRLRLSMVVKVSCGVMDPRGLDV
jgi:hypothetical protein